MRILYLNPVGTLGGAERSLLDLATSVRQAMPEAELHLVVSTPGPLIQEAREIGIKVVLLPMPPTMLQLGDSGWSRRLSLKAHLSWLQKTPRVALEGLTYVRKLKEILTTLRPDVVHSNGIKFHLLARLAASKELPVVWHIRDFLSLRPMVSKFLHLAARRNQKGIVISRAVEEDVRKVLGPIPLEMIYNGVDIRFFSPGPGDGTKLDSLAGLKHLESKAPLRVGLVATFARWKGHELFLQAASQFFHKSPKSNVRFYIIGGPIYSTNGSQYSETELRSIIARLGLGDRVGLIGFQENPAEIYRALDIVVHASTKPEPFGRTIVEAMACGKSVIVSEAGGAVELFTNNIDAVGFPPCDSAALARAMGRLIADPQLRQIIGKNARRTAVERFSRQRLGLQFLDVYSRLLDPIDCRLPPDVKKLGNDPIRDSVPIPNCR
jgi:glycosyltransferase involved in cell wall biosynthesis